MSSNQEGEAVQDASSSSFGTTAPVATPSAQDKVINDIACVKAAISLARETGNASFLRLAHNKPLCGRYSVIAKGKRAVRLILDTVGDFIDLNQAEALVKDLESLWSDDPSIDLDPAVIRALANCDDNTKTDIPPACARAFILEFSRRANTVGLNVHDWSQITETVHAAFESVQTALGNSTVRSTRAETGRYHTTYKGMSGKILQQIKGIVDSIIADADQRIDSDKQELQNLESLLKELGGKTGDAVDTGSLLQDVCRVYMTQAHGFTEAIRQKLQSLSKFLEGSIDILQSP